MTTIRDKSGLIILARKQEWKGILMHKIIAYAVILYRWDILRYTKD